jgi:glycine reductase
MLTQPFRLELETFRVRDLQLGDHSELAGGTLTLDAGELATLIRQDPRIAEARVEIARPGEPARIVHCLDALEPRAKVEGPGVVFPGFLGGPETVGRGKTVRLAGVSVITSSRYPQPFSGLLAAREAVVEMSGPAANYSPFSRTLNIVLALAPQPGLDNADYDDAVRRAGLKIADRLARLAVGGAPDEKTVFDFSKRAPNLPNVAYFYQLQGQGSMADTYLYGRTIENLVPTLIHPNEIMDGAIVSGVYVYAAFKNPTYLHLNNPILWELATRHGKDLNFVGVILNRGHNYTQAEKERSSYWAAKLAGFLAADGVILTGEGGGNSAIDLMLACQYLEQMGIKTTALSYENPGPDGRGLPLFFTVPEADAVVSLGMAEGSAHMPAVERVLGDERLLDDETPAIGPFDLPMYYHFCAVSQVGGNVLAGRQF